MYSRLDLAYTGLVETETTMHLVFLLGVASLYLLFPRAFKLTLALTAISVVGFILWAWSASQGGTVDCSATPLVESCTAWWLH